MKRFFLSTLLAVMAFAILSCGLGFVVKKDGKAVLFGRVYNGLTRAAFAKTSGAGQITLTGLFGLDVRTVDIDEKGGFIFKDIPTDTPFIIEFTISGFMPFLFESSSGIQDNVTTFASGAGTGDVYAIYENDPGDLQNIYLFPTNVNPGNLTIVIYDADNGVTIDSAGTVLLFPSGTSSLDNTPLSGFPVLPNGYYINAPKQTVTLANGTGSVLGTGLMLGASYRSEVYGVSGYRIFESSSPFTVDSTSDSTLRIALSQVATVALRVIQRSDFNSFGQQAAVGSAGIVLTFDKDIEVNPSTANTAQISSITAPDTDNDTVVTGLAVFTGSATVVSNHLTVAASGRQLTITVKTGALTTEDTGDLLSIAMSLGSISVRPVGTITYTTLNAGPSLWDNSNWNTGTVIIRQ
jgi:hypothetical protein